MTTTTTATKMSTRDVAIHTYSFSSLLLFLYIFILTSHGNDIFRLNNSLLLKFYHHRRYGGNRSWLMLSPLPSQSVVVAIVASRSRCKLNWIAFIRWRYFLYENWIDRGSHYRSWEHHPALLPPPPKKNSISRLNSNLWRGKSENQSASLKLKTHTDTNREN